LNWIVVAISFAVAELVATTTLLNVPHGMVNYQTYDGLLIFLAAVGCVFAVYSFRTRTMSAGQRSLVLGIGVAAALSPVVAALAVYMMTGGA
jgi:hypothetical protein